MARKKSSGSKKTPAKSTKKKSTSVKSTTKKSTPTKTAKKKSAPAKKAVAKKTTAKKAAPKKAVKKATPKKKAVAKKTTAKKVAPKKVVKKAVAKKTTAKKVAPKKVVKKAVAKKSTSKGKATSLEPKHKGISRIDSKDTHGWFVRVYNETITYSKLFSDLKCGGRDKALNKAINFRDELIKEIGKTYPARRIVRRDKRNKSGVIGVCRTRKKNRNGTYSEYFSVSWSPEYGAHKCRMFSVNKHGEANAFKMACDWRKKMEEDIHGQTWVKRPRKTPQYLLDN